MAGKRWQDTTARLTRFERDEDGWKFKFTCGTGDFHAVVEALKDRIDPMDREWIPSEKCWWVHESCVDDLAGLFSNFEAMRQQTRDRGHWQAGEQTKTPPPSDGVPTPVRNSFAALYLLPDAPPEVVKAAYKACAMLHHPDHGGNTERMKQVNLAFELSYQWSMQHRKQSA